MTLTQSAKTPPPVRKFSFETVRYIVLFVYYSYSRIKEQEERKQKNRKKRKEKENLAPFSVGDYGIVERRRIDEGKREREYVKNRDGVAVRRGHCVSLPLFDRTAKLPVITQGIR